MSFTTFSVSYSEKTHAQEKWHRSCEQGMTPYYDWCGKYMKHRDTVFTYGDWHALSSFNIMFLPGMRLLYIRVYSLSRYVGVFVARVEIDEDAQLVRVIHAASQVARLDLILATGLALTRDAGVWEFQKAMVDKRDMCGCGPEASFLTEFFGPGWDIEYDLTSPSVHAPWKYGVKQREHLGKWCSDIFKGMPRRKTVALYDYERVEAAATRIWSFWQGWKTRMTYRYNPETTLGKYLAIKMYKEVACA